MQGCILPKEEMLYFPAETDVHVVAVNGGLCPWLLGALFDSQRYKKDGHMMLPYCHFVKGQTAIRCELFCRLEQPRIPSNTCPTRVWMVG